MQRNEKDLTFFEQALEQEEDPHRKMLLLEQIRNIKREILERLREERARVRRENELMQKALDMFEADKSKKEWGPIYWFQPLKLLCAAEGSHFNNHASHFHKE